MNIYLIMIFFLEFFGLDNYILSTNPLTLGSRPIGLYTDYHYSLGFHSHHVKIWDHFLSNYVFLYRQSCKQCGSNIFISNIELIPVFTISAFRLCLVCHRLDFDITLYYDYDVTLHYSRNFEFAEVEMHHTTKVRLSSTHSDFNAQLMEVFQRELKLNFFFPRSMSIFFYSLRLLKLNSCISKYNN